MIWLIKVAKSLTCYVQHSIVRKILVLTAIIDFILRLESTKVLDSIAC